MRLPFRNGCQEVPGSGLSSLELLVLPHCPGNQRKVEMPQDRIHGRRMKTPIIIQPTPKHGIEHPGDLRQPKVRSIANVPLACGLPHGRESFRTYRRRKAHKQFILPEILCASRPEGVLEKIELRIRILTSAIRVFTVDNPSLVRMHLKATFRQLQRCFQPPLDVEDHPLPLRVLPYRAQQQFVVDVVEHAFYVEFQDPIILPASFACYRYGFRRLRFSLSIRATGSRSFTREPGSDSRLLYTGRRLSSYRVSDRLIPGHIEDPGFDERLVTFDASMEVHLRSSLTIHTWQGYIPLL